MKVSVLVCTYGDDEWLRRAVDAEASVEWHDDTEVRTLHDPAGTLASVRNRAAEDASGGWLCFLDADDQLAPGYLAAMRDTFARARGANLEAIIGEPRALLLPHVQYVADGRYTGDAFLPAAGRPVLDVNAGVIGTLVPRALFLEVGGFRELAVYEDWDLWLRCLRAGARPVSVPDAVYLADGSPGRNQSPGRREVYDAIRREYEPHLRGVRWPA